MKYLLDLQETPESKVLLEQLTTLKYVKVKKVSRNFQGEKETGSELSISGRIGRGYWIYSKEPVASTV